MASAWPALPQQSTTSSSPASKKRGAIQGFWPTGRPSALPTGRAAKPRVMDQGPPRHHCSRETGGPHEEIPPPKPNNVCELHLQRCSSLRGASDKDLPPVSQGSAGTRANPLDKRHHHPGATARSSRVGGAAPPSPLSVRRIVRCRRPRGGEAGAGEQTHAPEIVQERERVHENAARRIVNTSLCITHAYLASART